MEELIKAMRLGFRNRFLNMRPTGAWIPVHSWIHLVGLPLILFATTAMAQTDAGAPESPANLTAPSPSDAGVMTETSSTSESSSVGTQPPAGPSPGTPSTEADLNITVLNGKDLGELDLEELLENVVVTPTKSALREEEAPAITTVVSRDDLQRWGYQSIAEVLGHVAGVYMVDDHIIPNVGIRGISGGLRSESGLIKVMIDGRSVAFRSSAGNWLGPELVPLSAIQQIEIIRGPASALYGADAFMGVINIVTRRAMDIQGGEVSMLGSRQGGDGWGNDMVVGGTGNGWQFMAAVKRSSEDRSGLKLPTSSPSPKLPSYAPTDGRSHDLTLDSTVTLARASFALGTRGTASITGYLSRIDRGAEFADWQQLTHNLDRSGRGAGTNISLGQGFIGSDIQFTVSPSIDLRTSAHYFQGGPTSRDRIETGNDLFYIRRDFGYRGFEVTAEGSYRPNNRFTVLVGGGMITDRQKLVTVYNILKSPIGTGPNEQPGAAIPAMTPAGQKHFSNLGMNALVVWSALPKITLTAGARVDNHTIYGAKPSGRLAGVAELAPHLYLKLLYGSAFKAPSPQLLFGSPMAPGDIAGNEGLKPSYVHTFEAQLSYRPIRYLFLTSGLAYNYLLDQAAFAQRGLNQVAQNISKVGALSWETEARLDYKRKITGYANLTVNRTVVDLMDHGYIANLTEYNNAAYPVVVGNGGVSGEIPYLPLRASAEASYISSRRSSAANTLIAGNRYELGSYVLLGANIRTVGWRIFGQKESTFMVSVRNLANVRYSDPGFAGIDFPQLGRHYTLMFTQEF